MRFTGGMISLRYVFKTSKDLIFRSVIFLSKQLSNSVSGTSLLVDGVVVKPALTGPKGE